MFRSQSSDHHQGSITILVQLLLIGVHASSYSGMWLYVVCASVLTMYLSVSCLVMYYIHCFTLHMFRPQLALLNGRLCEFYSKERSNLHTLTLQR